MTPKSSMIISRLVRKQLGRGTTVERYWKRHTVNSPPFEDARASEDYLEWRFAEYPLFRELTGLWGDHDGERILDYGCGPGNDLVGFLLYSRAEEVIGADVSPKALALAEQRLELHQIDSTRSRLLRVDESAGLPLEDATIDHVSSLGVLHHVTHPEETVRELRRVLRDTGTCTVMVYNRRSVYFHLYTAYMRTILDGAFPGMSVEEAFRRNTDGPECPISRAYEPSVFLELARSAGFAGEFRGGYFLRHELDWLREHREAALASEELGREHKAFLRELEIGEDGYPTYQGAYAGIGGVYALGPA